MKKIILILVAFVVVSVAIGLFYSFSENSEAGFPNYEATGRLLQVKDGDTVEVEILDVRVPHSGISKGREEIRFARVDTEELDQEEAAGKHDGELNGMSQLEYEETVYHRRALEAKRLVWSVIKENSKVYLDFDDLAEGQGPYYDSYRGNFGRLIAVVYVRNGDRWINVNARVLRKDYPALAEITSYTSEFSARRWLQSDYPYA